MSNTIKHSYDSRATAEEHNVVHELIPADRVKGTAVFNMDGERLGHVEDLVVHKVSGRVAYAIMAFGGFLGIGELYHPLPWSMLKYDVRKEGYIVPLDRKALEEAPTIDRPQFGAADLTWSPSVLAYYGVAPLWL